MSVCRAHSRGGRPCKKHAIRGGSVCATHGGSAPQVKRKATERLLDLVNKPRALEEAAKLAFFDVTELYDDVGRLKPMRDWPEKVRAAVKSVETVRANLDKGDGQLDPVVKVVLADKVKALEMLFKHLQLFEDKLNVQGKIEIGWQE